jgi:hypothetical protein
MTYDQFIKEYIVDGRMYSSAEVITLIQQAWVQAINEQVQLEGRCVNRQSPWTNCKQQDFHLHTEDCPCPPDRECVQDCLRRCPPCSTSWQVSSG